jgi:hypothetical protein
MMKLLAPAAHDKDPEKCWYTRREGIRRGPFTAENITSYILLGRIRLDDELSQDCENWSVAGRLTSLLPAELAGQAGWDDYERLVIARMKVDERSNERRVNNDKSYTGFRRERRMTANRRGNDDNTLISHYLFDGTMSAQDRRSNPRRLRALLMVLLASLLFAWLGPVQQ